MGKKTVAEMEILVYIRQEQSRFSTIGSGGLVGQGFQRPLFEMGLSTGD